MSVELKFDNYLLFSFSWLNIENFTETRLIKFSLFFKFWVPNSNLLIFSLTFCIMKDFNPLKQKLSSKNISFFLDVDQEYSYNGFFFDQIFLYL